MKRFLLSISASLLLSAFCTGCKTAYGFMRAEPAPLTDFLPDNQKMKDQEPDFPFRKLWTDETVKWDKYRKIIIAPVNTDYLLKQQWWGQVNEEKVISDPKGDCAFIARYMETTFRKAIAKDPDHRFVLSDKPGPDTLVLEMAVTELVPTKAFFNAVTTVAGFFVPGAGLLSILNSGSVAFEGRLKDSQSGKIVAMFAEREKDTAAVIDVAGLQWYSHAEIIIDVWAGDFVTLSNSDDLNVKTRFPFRLIAW